MARDLPEVARQLITGHGIAPSTARLQPGRTKQRGALTRPTANLRERRIECTFRTANVPQVFYHGLGFPPSGYTQLTNNAAAQVYNETPLSSTSRVIVLLCSAATTVDVLVR